MVRPIEPTLWEVSQKPSEQRLMAYVHTQRDLWLLTVTPKRPLAHEHPDQETLIEGVPTLRFVCLRHNESVSRFSLR